VRLIGFSLIPVLHWHFWEVVSHTLFAVVQVLLSVQANPTNPALTVQTLEVQVVPVWQLALAQLPPGPSLQVESHTRPATQVFPPVQSPPTATGGAVVPGAFVTVVTPAVTFVEPVLASVVASVVAL